jgi:nicotinic acid mononucleotide adenylyltransferase
MGKVRICLYGISSNPPTGLGGHQGVIRFLAKSGLFDQIWVLPVYKHMYRSKQNMLDFDHRVTMCALSFPGESTPTCAVRVSELEKEVYEKQQALGTSDGSTVALLQHVRQHDKKETCSWHIVVGSDVYMDLAAGKWKSSAEVVDLVDSVEVAIRKFPSAGAAQNVEETDVSTAATKIASIREKANFHHIPHLTDVSSTQVRSALSGAGVADAAGADLHPQVAAYITTHGLYADTTTAIMSATDKSVPTAAAGYRCGTYTTIGVVAVAVIAGSAALAPQVYTEGKKVLRSIVSKLI